MFSKINSFLKNYRKDEEGLAAIEAGMLFPILFTLIFGIYDLGHGIIIKQKVVSASHIAGDLLARKSSVSDMDIADAVEAAKLAIDPYTRSPIGIDIASVEFSGTEDGDVIWRYTENSAENVNAVSDSIGLGEDGEGVLVVTLKYEYTPFFYKMFFDDIKMTEITFTRGRKSPVIRHEDMI
jgi:Flp pilus assembly protein TadG